VAESLATAATTSERDVLLATKLHVPVPRPGFVPRPRLTDRLEEGLRRGMELVCAPAGSGKTVLLSGWVRDGGRPVAWLSLDAGDNDPARFWRRAVAALDEVCPGIGERVGLLLRPPPSSFEGLVTAVINELDAEPAAYAGEAAPARRRRRGGAGAGARPLSPGRLAAGARLARVPAGAPAASPAPGGGQPLRPAAVAGAVAGQRAARRVCGPPRPDARAAPAPPIAHRWPTSHPRTCAASASSSIAWDSRSSTRPGPKGEPFSSASNPGPIPTTLRATADNQAARKPSENPCSAVTLSKSP
jgi:hypothetical protein